MSGRLFGKTLIMKDGTWPRSWFLGYEKLTEMHNYQKELDGAPVFSFNIFLVLLWGWRAGLMNFYPNTSWREHIS